MCDLLQAKTGKSGKREFKTGNLSTQRVAKQKREFSLKFKTGKIGKREFSLKFKTGKIGKREFNSR